MLMLFKCECYRFIHRQFDAIFFIYYNFLSTRDRFKRSQECKITVQQKTKLDYNFLIIISSLEPDNPLHLVDII